MVIEPNLKVTYIINCANIQEIVTRRKGLLVLILSPQVRDREIYSGR
jgi:hypothetical protein